MSTTRSSTAGESFGLVAVVAMGFGAFVAAYGLLVLPASLLGGVRIAAIGGVQPDVAESDAADGVERNPRPRYRRSSRPDMEVGGP